MNITINDRIVITTKITPKKKKGNVQLYDMYICLDIFELGLKQKSCSISTGISLNVTDYVNGKVISRNVAVKQKEERLNEYLHKSKLLCEELRTKKITSCTQLKNEINQNGRRIITGKIGRGYKKDQITKLEGLTYSKILNSFLDSKTLHKDRRRNYLRTETLLNEFYKNDVPLIDQITKEEMKAFKKWFMKVHPMTNNAQTTYLAMFPSIFNYALEENLIEHSPIPKLFTGGFVDAERTVLSENEIGRIRDLEDSSLSTTLQVAKYCMLLQLLTGMGYGDLKGLTHDNYKYNENFDRYYIEKHRNKTGVKFTIYLSSYAIVVFNRLLVLTKGEETLFQLPSIEYTSRKYKEIGKLAAIKSNITTYTLRHSFAVNMMEKDGKLEDLKLCLGHTNISTTQIYGKISATRQIEKMDYLESKSTIHQLDANKAKNLLKAV